MRDVMAVLGEWFAAVASPPGFAGVCFFLAACAFLWSGYSTSLRLDEQTKTTESKTSEIQALVSGFRTQADGISRAELEELRHWKTLTLHLAEIARVQRLQAQFIDKRQRLQKAHDEYLQAIRFKDPGGILNRSHEVSMIDRAITDLDGIVRQIFPVGGIDYEPTTPEIDANEAPSEKDVLPNFRSRWRSIYLRYKHAQMQAHTRGEQIDNLLQRLEKELKKIGGAR